MLCLCRGLSTVSRVECLQRYEQQGGYINWTKPEAVDLLTAAKAKEEEKQNSRSYMTENKAVRESKNNPLGDPRLSHHSSCSRYFSNNNKLYSKMESGPEAFLFQHFGYQGCCNPGDAFVAPPAVPVTNNCLLYTSPSPRD